MGAHPAERYPHPHGALAARLDKRPRGLAQNGGIPGQEVRSLLPQLQQPAVGPTHLLAGIEAPGEIHGGGGGGGGQVEHHRQPALHVGGPEAPQGVSLDFGLFVVVGRDGVEMAGEHEALRAIERRAGHDVVPQARDLEPGAARQAFFHQVGEGVLGVAQRGDPDQLGRGL